MASRGANSAHSQRIVAKATREGAIMMKRQISHRPVLLLALALSLALAACGGGDTETASGGDVSETPDGTSSGQLVVASLGGSYQDAQRDAFFTPFAESSDAEVVEANQDGTIGELQSQVEAGNVQWDVVDLAPVDAQRAADEGLLEPLDRSVINDSGLIEGAMTDHIVATIYSSNVFTWNTDALTEPLTGAVDFWDLERFPGRRALPGYSPYGVLEQALVADGVAHEDLYPLDVERALTKLDEIKDDTEFFNTNEQGMQLVTSGQVAAASVPNGRVYNGVAAGDPLDYTWADGALFIDYWVVPRGAPNADLAMEFIAFASQPEPQAELASLIPYGGSHSETNELIPEDRQQDLPTGADNLAAAIQPDLEWWAENDVETTERWQAWLIE